MAKKPKKSSPKTDLSAWWPTFYGVVDISRRVGLTPKAALEVFRKAAFIYASGRFDELQEAKKAGRGEAPGQQGEPVRQKALPKRGNNATDL